MILTGIIYLLLSILWAIVQILPPVESLPEIINTSITYFSNVWNNWNPIFPIESLVEVIKWAISLESAIITFKLGDWIYKKIRG